MSKDIGDGPKDQVGYGKPPKQHQFKPGQSGNPKGLNKNMDTPEFGSDITDEFKMWVVVNKKRTRVSMTDAVLLQLNSEALKGDTVEVERYFRVKKMNEDIKEKRRKRALATPRPPPPPPDIPANYCERALYKLGILTDDECGYPRITTTAFNIAITLNPSIKIDGDLVKTLMLALEDFGCMNRFRFSPEKYRQDMEADREAREMSILASVSPIVDIMELMEQAELGPQSEESISNPRNYLF